MTYLIIKDNIIDNIIVADENFAQKNGLKEYYDGANIGELYSPPQEKVDLGIEEYAKATNYLELIKSGKFTYDDIIEEIKSDIKIVAKDQVIDNEMTVEQYEELFGEKYIN